MLKFTELLSPENIRQGLTCTSKKRAFEIISSLIAKQLSEQIDGLEADEVSLQEKETLCTDSLLNREKLGNSSLGNGMAMPKGRLPLGNTPIAVFLQLSAPLKYDALDHREVDLIFALLSPTEHCSNLVQELPHLVERLKDKSLIKQLRNAQSAEEIWQIFQFSDRQAETLPTTEQHHAETEHHEEE
ncbi:PTS sugar transporter subunit IIA [Histophilus somni]|uniref:PTS sugar transporter subunit IIA n=1 Tax=Histophilus somni TaxID=731 RepID=UPI00109D5D48|nr:PTS sugar transporter subunit IIA [Histophilus somni]QEH18147.1 PTS sugar transporter subunit IIA [Histophilus somni]THA21200.1 PTS sugar transporter subunit IIA [Histophilus somni]